MLEEAFRFLSTNAVAFPVIVFGCMVLFLSYVSRSEADGSDGSKNSDKMKVTSANEYIIIVALLVAIGSVLDQMNNN